MGEELPADADRAQLHRVEIALLCLRADDYLGAAAADVDEEGLFALQVGAADHALVDQARFFQAGDNTNVDAGLGAQHLDEGLPVARLARGGGGDGDYLADTAGACYLREVLRYVNGTAHSVRLQTLHGELALAQTDRFFAVVQGDGCMILFKPRNEQPD